MRIEVGINPNCSEAVVRINKTDWDSLKDKIIIELENRTSSWDWDINRIIDEVDDEVTFTHYQSDAGFVIAVMEELEIPYIYEPWTFGFDDLAYLFYPIPKKVKDVGKIIRPLTNEELDNWSDVAQWVRRPYPNGNGKRSVREIRKLIDSQQ